MSVSVNDKNIGHVTAYAYAKAKGYTGTEEEFAELMADYATVGREAAESASQAAQSATAAAGSATSAQTAKTDAETARTGAETASTAAQTAQTAAEAAQGKAETAQGKAESAQQAAEASKTQAEGSASAAATYATDAGNSATAAAGSATEAQTAKTGAETAQAAAETAKTGAESAAASVSASAAQIETNKQDIYTLKEDFETKLTATSENVLNKAALTIGKYVNKSGNTGYSSAYAYTDYIKVTEGDVVKGYAGKQTPLPFRFVCAYNSEKVAISSLGAEDVESYTVPSGISFLKLTGYVRTDGTGINSPTARIFLNGEDGKYQEYKTGDVLGFCSSIYATEQILANYPLTTITPYMVNLLSYRPLGVLTKGYICLVSDDGDSDLATYTIPMLQNKGDIPCTFAVMKSSTVFSTESGLSAVVDAVNNHGCNIAQHGGTTWDQYDELGLNNFFDSEKTYWDSIGLVPYGAVCPAHNINNLIRAICGGRFGCLRTGYQNGVPYYPDYTNGAKSNIFGLTSQSSVDSTLADQKRILDNIKANNLLRIIHWHENELTTEKKEQLEGIIDYALEIGLTFITMKEIPNII